MVNDQNQFANLPKLEDARIAIIGLGYVGLPLALEFAKRFPVVGFDINKQRIGDLRDGKDVTREARAEELIDATSLTLTSNPRDLADANVYIVSVPTPIDEHRRPDLGPLISASETVGKVLQPGNVVIFESTVYPGCTEEDCVPILERESGLTCAFDPAVPPPACGGRSGGGQPGASDASVNRFVASSLRRFETTKRPNDTSSRATARNESTRATRSTACRPSSRSPAVQPERRQNSSTGCIRKSLPPAPTVPRRSAWPRPPRSSKTPSATSTSG